MISLRSCEVILSTWFLSDIVFKVGVVETTVMLTGGGRLGKCEIVLLVETQGGVTVTGAGAGVGV